MKSSFDIAIRGLEQRYPDFRLGPLDLDIPAGQCLAVIGPNGAGKSSLFRLLTGSADAEAGTVHIGDERMRPEAYLLKRRLGYLPQELDLPQWVTGRELLAYSASLHELAQPDARIAEVVGRFDCEGFIGRPVAVCSHGMRKRVGLALAVLHAPAVLILDEPFSGLDLFHIRALTELIAARTAAGQTTILSTHIAPYAAQLATHGIALQSGQLHEWPEWGTHALAARIGLIEAFFFGAGS